MAEATVGARVEAAWPRGSTGWVQQAVLGPGLRPSAPRHRELGRPVVGWRLEGVREEARVLGRRGCQPVETPSLLAASRAVLCLTPQATYFQKEIIPNPEALHGGGFFHLALLMS